MQLTGGFKLKKVHWVVLDLLAVALFVGLVTAFFAMAIGAWWPFASLDIPYWPLLAYLVWLPVVIMIGLFVGWQLQTVGFGETAETAPQPSPERPVVESAAGLTLKAVREMPAPRLRREAVGYEAWHIEGSEEEEPALAAAGR